MVVVEVVTMTENEKTTQGAAPRATRRAAEMTAELTAELTAESTAREITGAAAAETPDELRDGYDVVVVGGGAAGLSAGLMLSRARRSVVVLDAGAPRNAPAAGVHGLLGLDGISPRELLARGRAEVRRYGGQVVPGEVATATRPTHEEPDGPSSPDGPSHADGPSSPDGRSHADGPSHPDRPTDPDTPNSRDTPNGRETPNSRDTPNSRNNPAPSPFTLVLTDGRTVTARRLLVATGLVDELPSLPGLRERWGRDVVHCPYCHGWEVRDRAVGVLAVGPMAVHQALMFRQWSADVTLFTQGTPQPDEEQAEQLAARGIRVVDGEVAGLEVTGDRLTGLRLKDGRVLAREVLAVAAPMSARVGFLAGLGLRAVEHPGGAGSYLPADALGRTEVPGVWVAGNAADLSAQVGASAAAGAAAAAQVNADLIAEETRRAVAAHRAPFSAASEARVSALVTGDRRHGL